ncbi:hypothetical protein CEXT_142711 [Caerostris extrusa]|uniref:Uncharacterized protein n=1 Tax=Caerostris extrusa TaxID=172846 RepID=A0AAV4ULQ1_CAEEX|nr:hypothetical protein CEXT_142711 [Caerostris extrusa]
MGAKIVLFPWNKRGREFLSFCERSPAPEPYPGTICPGSVNSPLLSVDEGKGFLITANFQVFPQLLLAKQRKIPVDKGEPMCRYERHARARLEKDCVYWKLHD